MEEIKNTGGVWESGSDLGSPTWAGPTYHELQQEPSSGPRNQVSMMGASAWHHLGIPAAALKKSKEISICSEEMIILIFFLEKG